MQGEADSPVPEIECRYIPSAWAEAAAQPMASNDPASALPQSRPAKMHDKMHDN
jgi:hypothetical protein